MTRNDEAIAEYSAVLRANPRHFHVLVDRGCIWHETEAYDKAIADFTEAIKLRPNPFAYMSRGMAYSSIRDFSKAKADFERALKLSPNSTQTLLARGMLWLTMKDAKKALQDFDAAIKLDSEDYQNYVARLMALNQAERFEEAVKDCEQLIRLKPESAKSYLFRGQEYRSLRRWSEAFADLEHALKLDGKDAQVLAEAAYLRAACPIEEFRNPKTALKLATLAVSQSQGKLLFAHRALAAAHAAQGDFKKAMVAQKQALKLSDPDEMADEQERLALYEARKPFLLK